MKYFHVMSDRKTLRELSREDYLKTVGRKNWMLGWIDGKDILFVKNTDVIYFSMEQLQKSLQLNKKEP